MNRDELLEACFGKAAAESYQPGARVTELIDGPNVLGHLDTSYRRVLVRRETRSIGEGIQTAWETLPLAAFSNVCVDPGERGKGYGRQVLEQALTDARDRVLIEYAALFADDAGFFERLGFENPEGAPAGFLVCSLRGLAWPTGSVDPQGKW
jgi:GNAT superfamily N-acetyltransferase